MPTASTAQILGNNESIEAYTNNIYTRRVLSGEFQVSPFMISFVWGIFVIPWESYPQLQVREDIKALP